MNVDQERSAASRVARHAALADPTRLAIVDALALGDLAPAELQHRLGVASNLLAHHLKILQAAGMVSRHRSEGDRRRVYLRLRQDAFVGLCAAGGADLAAARVVFVCTANSARSQLAEALWARASTIPVTSAGTHPAPHVHPGASAAARRHGLPLVGATPQSVDAVLGEDDFVVTVCDSAHEELATRPALHWSIRDPVVVGTAAAFDAAHDELADRITVLSAHLAAPAH